MERFFRTLVVGGEPTRAPDLDGDVLHFGSRRDRGTGDIRRAVAHVRSGKVDLVVLLVRFLGHPATNALRRAASSEGIPVVLITGGWSSVRRAIAGRRGEVDHG